MTRGRCGLTAPCGYDPDDAAQPASEGRQIGLAHRPARRGLREIAPLLLGIVPFSVVVGVTAVDRGYGLDGAVLSSVVVYAGAAQLVFFDLVAGGTPLAVAIGSGLLVNARMLMYGAGLAPLFADLSLPRRAAGAYLMTDPGYALTALRYRHVEESVASRWRYYLTVGTTMWLVWQAGTVAGALLGDLVPDWLPADLGLPLMMIALLMLSMTDRATLVAAVTSGVVVTLAWPLPAGLGLLVGALAGVAAGTVVALRGRR